MRKVISKDGTAIAFDRSGEGPAVILVCGASTTRSANAPLAALLAQHFSVFNYDRRGRGDSDNTLPYEVEQYQAWHCRRLVDAKPGITGLWQVVGRSRTTFDEMVRLDLRYAKTCSFWTDVKILLATPRAVISGKGAC